MSTVVHKITLERRGSVNTVEYSPQEWFINPVEPGCDKKYWVVEGEQIIECSAERRALIDSGELEAARYDKLIVVVEYLKEYVERKFPDYVQRDFLLKLWLASEQNNQEVKAYIYPLIAWIANGQSLMREAKKRINEATTAEELSVADYDYEAFALWYQTQPDVTNEHAEELLNG